MLRYVVKKRKVKKEIKDPIIGYPFMRGRAYYEYAEVSEPILQYYDGNQEAWVDVETVLLDTIEDEEED